MLAKKIPCNQCRTLESAVDTYLDGELDPPQIVAVEEHLSDCAVCRERVSLARAMRSTLRQKACVPASLRIRISACVKAERDASRSEAPPSQLPVMARLALPLAVAAGVALVLAFRSSQPANDSQASVSNAPATASMTIGLDGLLDDLVSLHAQPLPPEITQADEMRKFDSFVGVKLEPPKLQPFGAQFHGGRILPLRDQRAAMLQYALADGHRVTLYVYDSKRVQPRSKHLHERILRDTPMFVGKVRGYNVAAVERRGVGYAFASDLDEPQSMELAVAAVP